MVCALLILDPAASIIPISIPVIPGLTAKSNRKRKGEEISKPVRKDGGDCDDDSEVEILEASPKSAKIEVTSKRVPSMSTTDTSAKSSSLSEEDVDSDDSDSLFTPI